MIIVNSLQFVVVASHYGGGDGPHDQLRDLGLLLFDWRILQANPSSGSHFWRGINLEINIDISQSGLEFLSSPWTASILAVRVATLLMV